MKINSTVNTAEFLKKFKDAQQLIITASEKTINATLQEMYERIVSRTPVGNPALWKWPAPRNYNPGTLKASWQISFGGMREESTGRFVSTDSVINGHGISLQVRGGQSTVNIYNTQPYAWRVETGWSTQAPQGMLRITVAEYTSILNQQASKYRIT